jgi:molybdopterin converting factor small subunit
LGAAVDEQGAAVESPREGEDVKVQAYGKLADLFGHERDVEIDLPCTVAHLRTCLAAQFPDAAQPLANKRVLACVGDVVVPDSYVLAGETVELLSPVSGG